MRVIYALFFGLEVGLIAWTPSPLAKGCFAVGLLVAFGNYMGEVLSGIQAKRG